MYIVIVLSMDGWTSFVIPLSFHFPIDQTNSYRNQNKPLDTLQSRQSRI